MSDNNIDLNFLAEQQRRILEEMRANQRANRAQLELLDKRFTDLSDTTVNAINLLKEMLTALRNARAEEDEE